jgi:hypothetical protein
MRKILKTIIFIAIVNLTVSAGFDFAPSAHVVDPQNREVQPSGQGCGAPIGFCNY